MSNERKAEIIIMAGCIILFIVLWPFIKWLAGIIALVGLFVLLYAILKSKSVKEEIEKDPQKHFDNVKSDRENKEK